MIVLEGRITLSRDIEIARAAGARQEQTCESTYSAPRIGGPPGRPANVRLEVKFLL